MHFLANNWLALISLAISVGLAALRGNEWWRARDRTTVSCVEHVISEGLGDGTSANHRYLSVTVRNVGRSVGVEGVSFHAAADGKNRSNIMWTPPPFDFSPPHGVEAPRPSPTSVYLLTDGQSVTWAFVVRRMADGVDPLAPFLVEAKVALGSGRVVTSRQARYSPTPPQGEIH